MSSDSTAISIKPDAAENTSNATALLYGDCNPDEHLWYIFFLSSIFSFLGALTLVLCGRCINAVCKRQSGRSSNQHKVADHQKNLLTARHGDIGCVTAAKDWAGELISGQTNSGRILVRNHVYIVRNLALVASCLSMSMIS